jgi:hypothetical protein
MAAADSGIDPRYAAQFQRGFDPAQHPPVEHRGPLRIEVPRAVVQRVADPPPLVGRAAVERRPVERPSVERPAADRADDDALYEDADDVPAPRSRVEWALLAAGVGMIVVSAWMLWTWAGEQSGMYSGGYSNDVASQLRWMSLQSLPGPLFVSGIVAVSLWIVLRSLGPTGVRR